MYARTVEDANSGEEQVLTFGVSGKLIRNVLVMFDRETDSYWGQLLGEAIEGPLKGTQLTPLAAAQTTWSEWKNQYPETKALFTNGAGLHDIYDTYYDSRQTGVLDETVQDDRLYGKALIAGIVINDQPVAYPHEFLKEEMVVNDTVEDMALTVWFDPPSGTARIYERTIITDSAEEVTLTFTATSAELEFMDMETGSTWLLLNGKAIDGPLEGITLTAIPSTNSFWFGWKDWYPETIIYGL